MILETNNHDTICQSLESLITSVETLIAELECDWEGYIPKDYCELFNCINNKIKAARNALVADND